MLHKHGVHRQQVLTGGLGFDQSLQRDSVFNGIFPCRYPAQGFHAAAAAQSFTDILAKGPDVSTFGTVDQKLCGIACKIQTLQPMDGDGPGLPFHFPALSCQIAQFLTAYLDGGVHGRDLPDLSPELLQRGQKLRFGDMHFFFFQHGTGDVFRIGGNP